MPDSRDDDLLALGTLVRGALVEADRMGLLDVAIILDSALNRLVALDPTGRVMPVPFEYHEEEDAREQHGSLAA